MSRWGLMAVALAACGSAQPAPLTGGGSEWEPWANECATKSTVVEAGDNALEGVIVDCMTGEKISGASIVAMNPADVLDRHEVTSDAAGRYRLPLPEGRYRVDAFLERGALEDQGEIEIRAHHVTVKEIRLDFPRCPPARGGPAVNPPADLTALITAVLDHHAAGGIVDAPPRSDGPTYVTIEGLRTLALPPNNARDYVVTTTDDLQRMATLRGRDIQFLNIFDLEIAGSCATASAGGDFVVARPDDIRKLCCCTETEVFLRRGGRWMFRMSRRGPCS